MYHKKNNYSAANNSRSGDDHIARIDILKGLGIILVVIGHICSYGTVYRLIYSFHIPLFFLASGYLYRARNIIFDIKRRIRTIVIPYFSFGFTVLIYWILIERRFRYSDTSPLQAFLGLLSGEYVLLDFNVHLWFLPCFFSTVIIYNILRIYTGKAGTFFAVMLLSGLYALEPFAPYTLPDLPWGLDRVCGFIFFYALGNFIREKGADALLEKMKPVRLLTSGAALLTVCLVITFRFGTPGPVYFLTGAAGSLGMLLIAELLSRYKWSAFLRNIGQMTIVILCIHGPVYRVLIKIYSLIFRLDTITVRSRFFPVVLITVMTLFVCCFIYKIAEKKVPWTIGR